MKLHQSRETYLSLHCPDLVTTLSQQNKQKAVRIVSTGRQGRNPLWVSVEEEQIKSTDTGKNNIYI